MSTLIRSEFGNEAVPVEPAAKRCVTKLTSGEYNEPADLGALRDCQTREWQAAIDRVFQKTGRMPDAATLEKIDERQQAEARSFLARHVTGDDDLGRAPAKPEDVDKNPDRRRNR